MGQLGDAPLRASATSPRPTSCPTPHQPKNVCHDVRYWFWDSWKETEFDRCGCGTCYLDIPGPECSYQDPNDRTNRYKPAPYWGTGYNGCYCWCPFRGNFGCSSSS